MKRILLCIVAISIGLTSFAQNKNAAKFNPPSALMKSSVADFNTAALPAKAPNVVSNKSTALNKILFSSSGNALTTQFAFLKGLSANQDLELITWTGRAGGVFGGTSNEYKVRYTDDFGSTIDTMILPTDGAKSNRYPSGQIFNPAGNTTVGNAYLVYTGPWHESGVWKGNNMGVVKLDGSFDTVVYKAWGVDDYTDNAAIADITVCDDSTAHGMQAVWKIAGNYMNWKYAEAYNGVFNTATQNFDWSFVKIDPRFMDDSYTGYKAVNDWNEVWSPDGTVGYIIFTAFDSIHPYSYAPIVYKSVNKGATWTKQPVFDFSTLSDITDYIWPTLADQLVAKPFFNELSGVVDENNELHMFGTVQGHYSIDPDSIDFTFLYEPTKFCEIYTSGSTWAGRVLDTIWTSTVATDETTYGHGWDHRIQASRTDDGTKLFVTWTDTDTTYSDKNEFPDIFAYGIDITPGGKTVKKSFTRGTIYDSKNFFHYTAPQVIYTAGTYVLPTTTIDDVLPTTDSDPIVIQYVEGIEYTDADFVGINEVKKNTLSISQNYPNPANGVTTITVNLPKASNVSLDVVNLMGQKVYATSFNAAAGNHTLKIDASKWNAGVYFYTVKAGEASSTKKMIVR